MVHPKFTLFAGKDGQFYFRLTAPNGEPILASEGYAAKSGCLNGIESVKTNAPDDERYNRLESSDGRYYFTLTAPNNQVIGKSEMYNSESARENGIGSVKANATAAPIEDTTT
jgi:uncharacterized protein